MYYTSTYSSPLGEILLAADEGGLVGLWFVGQRFFAACLGAEREMRELPIFIDAKRWLDKYFSGIEPDFVPQLHMKGTNFQMTVWNFLTKIPYGKTLTYGEIAKQLAAECDMQCMSAQAVGAAVGRNKISLIVPCHRVMGARGKLTGYAGGLYRKLALLHLEGIKMGEV